MSLGPSLVVPGGVISVNDSVLASVGRGALVGVVGLSVSAAAMATTLHPLTASGESIVKCSVT